MSPLVDVQLARRRRPSAPDHAPQPVRQVGEATAVVGERHPGRCGAELLLGEPLDVVAAGGDQRVDQRVAVLGEAVAEVVAGRRAARRSSRRRRLACPGRRRCRPGSAWSGRRRARSPRAWRRSGCGRSRACRTAMPGQPGGPFGVGDVAPGSRPGRSSLNENGTVIRRPSNSGIATCIAASIGDSAAFDASHCARELVRHRPCSTGTSRPASAPASQSSSRRSRIRGCGAAGREHGRDHRVAPG